MLLSWLCILNIPLRFISPSPCCRDSTTSESNCLHSKMGLLNCMYYFHSTAWTSWLCFIHIHLSPPPSVWVSIPGEFLHSSPSCFIPYFLVYVNRSKAFKAPRQRMMIKHCTWSMTLKRSNSPYTCISHRRNSRNVKIHFWSQWPHVSLWRLIEKNNIWERKDCIFFVLHIVVRAPRALLITWLNVCRPVSLRAGRSQHQRRGAVRGSTSVCQMFQM